ncbi:hypothetical protein FJZ26_05170 [Candidatus Parvarchaeota archaeon]|nr:hypothetical protein [Candidatus Parvarchaeota archaeon]
MGKMKANNEAVKAARFGCTCALEIYLPGAKAAKDACRALAQETEFKKRSLSSISPKGSKLVIRIKADDVVALRATINSYLRLLSVIESIEAENSS